MSPQRRHTRSEQADEAQPSAAKEDPAVDGTGQAKGVKRTAVDISCSIMQSNTAASHPALQTCTQTAHMYEIDAMRGCAACQRTCHTDCRSHLCRYVPCEHCLSCEVLTIFESRACYERQTMQGCHACGRAGCWTSAATCPARSQRDAAASAAAVAASAAEQRALAAKQRGIGNTSHAAGLQQQVSGADLSCFGASARSRLRQALVANQTGMATALPSVLCTA